MKAEFVEFNEVIKLNHTVYKLKMAVVTLIGLLVVVCAAPFFAPVEVKVGDVCLSCWGH